MISVGLANLKPTDVCMHQSVQNYLQNNPSLQAIPTNSGQLYVVGEPLSRQLHQLSLHLSRLVPEQTIEVIHIDLIDYQVFQNRNQAAKNSETHDSRKKYNEKLQTVLARAVESKASDLFIDVFREERLSRLSYKIFSYKRQVAEYDAETAIQLIRALWSKASNSNYEETAPCDCSFTFQRAGKDYRIRANSLPDVRGPSVVCRIRNPALVLLLSDCGYSKVQQQLIRRLSRLPGGLVLVSGETNSGKSTTLASLMQAMPSTRKIIEIADPVEVLMPHVTHVELNKNMEKADEHYARIQGAIVRQNPDTLVLGEIRDGITAKAAMSMAIQGKLVYSTLHTQSCLSAIPRLENLGVDAHLLGLKEFLGGIINQNLVPLICQACALPVAESDDTQKHYRALFGSGIRFINPTGCTACSHGIVGQTLVAEVYPLGLDRSGKAHKLIAQRDLVALEHYMADAFGVQSKHEHAAEKIRKGLIDPVATENIIGEFQPQITVAGKICHA